MRPILMATEYVSSGRWIRARVQPAEHAGRAAEQGDEPDEAWSTSKLRRLSPVLDGHSSMTATWPAFIQHGSDPCLTYVSDQEEWDSDPDLSAWPYEAHDRLVDAEGWQYR